MAIPSDLYHDLDAPHIYWQQDEEEARKKLAYEWVKALARDIECENSPKDHRTGCMTRILRTVADVLINERGWTHREAAEACVMEGVRAGGEIERIKERIAKEKWEAKQLAKKNGGTK